MTRDPLIDLAAVLHPLPVGIPSDDDEWSPTVDAVHEQREAAVANWQTALDAGAEIADEENSRLYDPVLGEIAGARRAVIQAEEQLRLLLAYAREFVTPRPYTLAHLAHAAGMSISGVRTAYGSDEIREVARRTGARPRPTSTPQHTP